MKGILIASALVLAGCVNLDIDLARPNPDVQPSRMSEDCAHMVILPILVGTLTIQGAMEKSGHYEPTSPGYADKFIRTPITKVHSVTRTQFGVPFYSEVCIQVTGE